MADAREARLPKWAQQELTALRRSLREAERQRDEARRGGIDHSRTVVHPYDKQPLMLPERATIAFALGDKTDPTDTLPGVIHVRHEGDYLEVAGMGGIVIEPQVSNVIKVRPRPLDW